MVSFLIKNRNQSFNFDSTFHMNIDLVFINGLYQTLHIKEIEINNSEHFEKKTLMETVILLRNITDV